MATALVGVFGCVHAAQVAYIGAAVGCGIGIENLFVMAGARDADVVAVADDGSGIENGDDDVIWIFSTANERVDAVVGIVGVNPLEALPLKIDFVQSGFVSYQFIEIGWDATSGRRRPGEEESGRASGDGPGGRVRLRSCRPGCLHWCRRRMRNRY